MRTNLPWPGSPHPCRQKRSHIIDPRPNLQLPSFAGCGATSTLHHATETGVSISSIFQPAEDLGVLGRCG